MKDTEARRRLEYAEHNHGTLRFDLEQAKKDIRRLQDALVKHLKVHFEVPDDAPAFTVVAE